MALVCKLNYSFPQITWNYYLWTSWEYVITRLTYFVDDFLIQYSHNEIGSLRGSSWFVHSASSWRCLSTIVASVISFLVIAIDTACVTIAFIYALTTTAQSKPLNLRLYPAFVISRNPKISWTARLSVTSAKWFPNKYIQNL
jgi:hypothetical protein